MGCMNSKPAADGASHPAPKASSANMSTIVQDLDGSLDEKNAEVLRELRLLDSELVASLQRGDIRLLRATWLCAQPDGFLLPNRQELEALEAAGTSSPLLRPEEAVAMIHCSDRRVGVLSHGWLTARHCDPSAARADVVIKALRQFPHLQAIFWDVRQLLSSPLTSASAAKALLLYAAAHRGLPRSRLATPAVWEHVSEAT